MVLAQPANCCSSPSSPQLALFGEKSGPEAYVPLKNGGIPVHVKMAREAAQSRASQSAPAASPQTVVNVHNAPPGTQVQESRDGNGGRRVDVVLKQAVGDAIGSSYGAAALRNNYGAGRRTVQR